MGGPELVNVYYPKTMDDELSDDGESALNGMRLEFDGDDNEGYDEFERDKNRLLAMGVFDDGSRGYDAPATVTATGLWLARGLVGGFRRLPALASVAVGGFARDDGNGGDGFR